MGNLCENGLVSKMEDYSFQYSFFEKKSGKVPKNKLKMQDYAKKRLTNERGVFMLIL